MDDKGRLAGFHQTISQQLNARLEESPRFFWALVAISTGYGYVLWGTSQAEQCQHLLVLIGAGALSYAAVLWASWYLAALGYAFRFLQNSQHCIEHALRWRPNCVPVGDNVGEGAGAPPQANGPQPRVIFWLLPGIYHAHAGGL